MKISLLTLENCNRCKRVKELLNKNNIEYHEIPCNSNDINSNECDKIEAITNASMYPMAVVSPNNDLNSIIIFEPDNYKDLKPPYNYRLDIKLNPVNSAEQIVESIKKLLY